MHPVKKRGGGFNLIWIDCLTSFTVIHTYIHTYKLLCYFQENNYLRVVAQWKVFFM